MSESSFLRQWEVEAGKAYEVYLTTQDGLWRYAIGDVVTIVGFDPTDGQPVIRFTGRTRFETLVGPMDSEESTLTSVIARISAWRTRLFLRRTSLTPFAPLRNTPDR